MPDSNKLQPAFAYSPESIRRGCIFDRPGDFDDLLADLNEQGPWSWHTSEDAMLDTILETAPEPGMTIQIREGLECMEADGSITPPEYGFMALLIATPERIDAFELEFQTTLKDIAAANIAVKDEYFW